MLSLISSYLEIGFQEHDIIIKNENQKMKTYYESELKELQGKRYTDVKELEKAEAEVNKEVAKKQELASARKAEADKVSKTIVNFV